MSTFISVGGYEASAMLNEPAFWLAPRSLPCLSHSPSVPVSSIAFTLSLCRAPRLPPPSSSVLVRSDPSSAVLVAPARSFSPSVLRKLHPVCSLLVRLCAASTPSRALARPSRSDTKARQYLGQACFAPREVSWAAFARANQKAS